VGKNGCDHDLAYVILFFDEILKIMVIFEALLSDNGCARLRPMAPEFTNL
jgi:hypothetical protein